MSVDLVSTSETNVTVSLDPAANTLDNTLLSELVASLSRLCRVQVIGPCASVSLVGRNIRAILHQLGGAFEFFEEQKIYLVSQAANDLNFTFVVDENQGDRLVEQLHELLIRPVPGDRVLGPTWEQLFSQAAERRLARARRGGCRSGTRSLRTLGDRDAAFVYDLEAVRSAARALRGLSSVVARALLHEGESASAGPAGRARGRRSNSSASRAGRSSGALELFPRHRPARILFTPNFAPRSEYAWAFEQGVRVTVDNTYVLSSWPEVFRKGAKSSFASTPASAAAITTTCAPPAPTPSSACQLTEAQHARQGLRRPPASRIVGLQAHVGSGIFDVTSWEQTARVLADMRPRFEDLYG